MLMKKIMAVLLTVIVLAANIVAANAQDTLGPVTFQQEINQTPNAILVDVRTPSEYAEGHLENARNIDWKSSDFAKRMDSIDHNAPLYLYCLGGGRSNAAANQLKKQGFTHIKQLKGGFLAWKNDNLPIEEASAASKDPYTKDDLQKTLQAHERVLVDFNAPWCGPCLIMAPKVKKIEKEFAGKIYVERINVDDAKDLTQSMGIRSIPMLILFENGKAVKALEGGQSLKEIRKFLQ